MIGFLSKLARSTARLRARREALEELRRRKLRDTVAFAYREIPLYRGLYGDTSPSVLDRADLRNLPVLSPEVLKSRPIDELKPHHACVDDLILHGTSGSTGSPFRFYQSREDVDIWYAHTLRYFALCGWRPWWTTAAVWREDPSRKDGLLRRLVERLKVQVSIHRPPEEQAEILAAHRPRMIYGISSTLDVLATWMLENDRVLGTARLVVGMGEAISEPMGRRFREAFGHRGLNFYGANECGLLGWECPLCGLFHFDEDALEVEVVDDDLHPVGPGERGRLLVTTLDRTVLPLIRYDIGDLVTLPSEPLPDCPVAFRRFSRVDGRVVDRLVLKDGRTMSWHHVYTVTTALPGVTRIQFAQSRDGEVTVRYVPREGFEPGDIEADILRRLPIAGNADLVFQARDEIPLEESGKFKLIKREG